MVEPKQNGFIGDKTFQDYERKNVGKKDTDQNPEFLWPSNQYQVYDGRQLVSKTLVRGYIRSIIGNTDGFMPSDFIGPMPPGQKPPPSPSTNGRLNFQFNPELIVRDVARSDGAINPLLTDPLNLTQPVPGTATFSFSMTLNREAEVAVGAPLREAGVAADGKNAAKIQGVMADIVILDSIIGQGISKRTIDTLLRYTQQAIITQNNTIDPADTTTVRGVAPDAVEVTKNLKANEGNQAFLNPMPVRIVFSKFLMVEGFVTSTAVAFQKFSPDMIPTIAQVNCVVQALYFGFAKEQAFLTDNLKAFGTATPNGTPISQPVVINTAISSALNNLKLKAKIWPNYYIPNLTTLKQIGTNISNNKDYNDGRINKQSWAAPVDTNASDDVKWAQGPYGDGEQYPGSNNMTIGFHQVFNIYNTNSFKGLDDINFITESTLVGFFNFGDANHPANSGLMPCLIEFNPIPKDKIDTTLNGNLEVFFEIKVTLKLKSGAVTVSGIPMNDVSFNNYSILLYENSKTYKGFTQCFLNFRNLLPPLKSYLPVYNPQGLTNRVRNYATAVHTFNLEYAVRPYVNTSNGVVFGKEKKCAVTYPWTYPGNALYRDNAGLANDVHDEVEFN